MLRSVSWLTPDDVRRLTGLYVVPPNTACHVADVGGGIGYSCVGPVRRRMLYRGGGIFEDDGAPESRLEFLGWSASGTAHATGWRELYYGMPMMTARFVSPIMQPPKRERR